MSTAMIALLSDNHAIRPPLMAEHGFSVLVQTSGRVALLDVGGSDLFSKNAGRMDFELFGVDDIIISHGHCDHTDGLACALTGAPAATLHIHPEILQHKYSCSTGKMLPIGMSDSALTAVRRAEAEGRLRLLDHAPVRLGGGMTIFASGGRQELPSGWHFFTSGDDGSTDPDHFTGELSLLVEGERYSLLLVGCSHTGLVALVKKAEEYTDKPVRFVFGGGHIDAASDADLDELASFFAARNTDLYLCHCTGISGFSRLYHRLPDRLHPTGTGMVLNLEL